jgi:hypothetical protein
MVSTIDRGTAMLKFRRGVSRGSERGAIEVHASFRYNRIDHVDLFARARRLARRLVLA